jgi:predicted nucleotide-binding protein (sugar kinase/HSP70/actin superfamily)
LDHAPIEKIYSQLERTAEKLSTIKTKVPISEAKKVALIGEIYVRNDDFSRLDLLKRLAEKEFVVSIAPIGEFVYYTNYLASKDTRYFSKNFSKKVGFNIRDMVQINIEKKIKKILCKSGLIDFEFSRIEDFIGKAEHLVKSDLEGETILTIGSALYEIHDHVCGVISIGPFGCMPSRIAESILNVEMNSHGKAKSNKKNFEAAIDDDIEHYPFLSIETDGNTFPQIIQSKIEIFMLQAERMHKKMNAVPVSH